MTTTGQETATKPEVEKGIRGKLQEDLKAVVADAEELLKATASQTGEQITAARGKPEESLKAAKVRIAAEEVAVLEKTKAAAKTTEDYLRANAWRAMGLTAAIGFILGILVVRR
jgi:ElaB/YqjD/DUF883 family membrane-anchored ribosome-binding protein